MLARLALAVEVLATLARALELRVVSALALRIASELALLLALDMGF